MQYKLLTGTCTNQVLTYKVTEVPCWR